MRKRNFVLFLVISIAVLSTGVNALPDLTVLDVWADGRTIMYMIRNIGDTNVSGVCSTLYVDGTPTRSNYLYPVGVGETKIGNFSSGMVYNWYCSGTSDTIRVHIDCEDAITESNENNNDWEYPWYCQGVTTTTSSTTSTVSTTTSIPPPPIPDNGTTTTTIPSAPPDNGTTTTITTTTTIANCHTKPLWDWSY
ncbi:MAG: hypothetical protein NT129_02180, partial [Candidatus Aenigmarchaeota archaeon]|nr:hypothetical protein [Candidatus Aenigmarchaeota archaeon]